MPAAVLTARGYPATTTAAKARTAARSPSAYDASFPVGSSNGGISSGGIQTTRPSRQVGTG